MSELPLSSRCVNVIKLVLEEFGAVQTRQILHAHSSFLSTLPRCYIMQEFSVNHMRTTNAHNSLSAQSDRPHCCLLLKNCSCQFWFSGRCEGICLNLCILGIFNRNIWDANKLGSGQTSLGFSLIIFSPFLFFRFLVNITRNQ